jgi:hypothetical protein
LILPTNRCFKDQIPMCFINSGRIYSPENPKVVIIEHCTTKLIIPNKFAHYNCRLQLLTTFDGALLPLSFLFSVNLLLPLRPENYQSIINIFLS